MTIKDYLQEIKELGIQGTLFRIRWELKLRSGLMGKLENNLPKIPNINHTNWIENIPFNPPNEVNKLLSSHIPKENLAYLLETAQDAIKGKILCFNRWKGDFSNPIDWYINPINKERWTESLHWSQALKEENRVGDVKLTWEIGRFPQAFYLARAASLSDKIFQKEFSKALEVQINSFIDKNPFPFGLHWHSSQEIVFRIIAWLFALKILLNNYVNKEFIDKVAKEILIAAFHIEQHIDYARYAVYNNHLLSEALGLLIIGKLFPEIPESKRWVELAIEILSEEAERQFYKDGAYIQQSHNYQRVALYDMVLACLFMKDNIPKSWLKALERSLDFLVAHQNPCDGTLPNYGANDGALPLILSTCNFSDFRPILQTLSIMLRGERLYPKGIWDEEAIWLLGDKTLSSKLKEPIHKSENFTLTGFYVMRGKDPSNFASFRCGTIKDRFSQIDMLHLDVYWKGLNILVDSGSYLYNGEPSWHNHFMGTSSHNTVTIDNLNQMKHHRRFKCLYWTKAKILEFKDTIDYTLCIGEHYGYQQHTSKCIHQRSILFLKDCLWIVVDEISGKSEHKAELNWLCGNFPYTYNNNQLTLNTPKGSFFITIYNKLAQSLLGSVVSGQESPPRGWLSRYYAEKVAVPSLLIEKKEALPITFISLLSEDEEKLSLEKNIWSIKNIKFELLNGKINLL
jgi:asparagine synthase (glutamine-hydrolysing)